MKDCKLSGYKIIIVEPCKSDLSNLDFRDEVHVNECSVKVLSLSVTLV